MRTGCAELPAGRAEKGRDFLRGSFKCAAICARVFTFSFFHSRESFSAIFWFFYKISDLLISDGCDWSGVIAKLFAKSMRPTRKAG
jgi:hypothetical protein